MNMSTTSRPTVIKLGGSVMVDEGALLIKFWLHLSKEKQEKRFKELEKNPLTRWKVTERDWKHFKAYDKFQEVHENVIRHTSTAEAPWHVIPANHKWYRNLVVAELMVARMRALKLKFP